MNFIFIAVLFVLALLLSRNMLLFIMLVTYKKKLFDPIDGRKSHNYVVPRLGGVAFAPIQCCLTVISFVFIFKVIPMDLGTQTWALLPNFMVLFCGLFTLFIVGIGDDLVGIGYRWKFLAQVIVASFFPLSGLWINDLQGLFFFSSLPYWVGVPLTIFVVVLIINAINLIDGIDGLCSGLVGIGTTVLGALFIYYGAWLHAFFAFITTGLLVPFFYFNVFGTNRRKRKIFMGDTGSMTLGFTLAFLTISFGMDNSYIKPLTEGALMVGFSILIVPVLDVVRVMYIRWRTGKPIFKPDRNHLHHKFLRAGMTHRTATMSIVGLALCFFLVNLILVQFVNINLLLFLDIFLWLTFHWVFDLIRPMTVGYAKGNPSDIGKDVINNSSSSTQLQETYLN